MATDRPDAAGTSYVGRRRELTTLEAALADSLSGRGRIVLVCGEPGIGKSRLLGEAERIARGCGVSVAWGRSTEADGAPPYWPWRQVLRAIDPQVRSTVDGGPDRFALAYRIAPDLAGSSELVDGGGGAELHGAERFGVFESVAELLRTAAAAAGLVVLLDDVHWADAPSLRLLEHVAAEWGDTRALLIAAHRPVGTDRDAPLRQAMAQLARVEGTVRMTLEGFTPEETAARLADVTGRQFPATTVASLRERTNGNPFFIGEFAQLLASGPTTIDTDRDIPQGVRDVIAQRVGRLPRASQEVLEVAAIVGAQPSATVVASVLEIPVADVLERFDAAADDGLLTRPSEGKEYSFAHALLRETLCVELPRAQRIRWHARVAAEVERLGGGDRSAHLSELAYHWLEAVPAGHADAAVHSAAAAAEAAMAQLAYEEAARLYEAAAGASTQTAAEPGRRARLLLSAARGWFLSGELERATSLCVDIARLARPAGDIELLAAAALVLEGVGDPQVSGVIAGLCREALAALPDGAVQLRSRLQAQLISAMVYLDDFEPLDRLSTAALEGAERSGDDDTLAAALRARHIACTDAGGLDERIRVTERLLEMAQRSHRVIDELWARLWRFDAALQRGLSAEAEREISAVAVLAQGIGQPLINWHVERCRFALSHARGDFAAARRAAEDGARSSRAAGELARIRRATQYMLLSLATGQDSDIEAGAAAHPAAALDARLTSTAVIIGRETFALRALFRGDPETAAAIYDALPGPDRWAVMPASLLIASGLRAMLAGLLHRREDSADMYRRLLPYADMFMTAGAGSVACLGPIELPLGVAARATGRLDAAVKHLERAVERTRDAGMRPAEAESQFQLALTLHARARDGDAGTALALLSACLEAARSLGMRPLLARATELREALRAGTRQARVLTPREMEIATMVAEGLTSREIADAMHISSRTADNHVQHILDKLDLRSRSQIAAWVVRELRTGA